MRLKDSFFYIESHDGNELPGKYGIRLNAAHAIFKGHFPGNPIFPGVLIIEALAQCCAIWLNRDGSGKLPVFAGIASARFRRKVQPGDTLELSVRFLSEKKGFYTFRTLAEVDGQPACEAELVVCYRES